MAFYEAILEILHYINNFANENSVQNHRLIFHPIPYLQWDLQE